MTQIIVSTGWMGMAEGMYVYIYIEREIKENVTTKVNEV